MIQMRHSNEEHDWTLEVLNLAQGDIVLQSAEQPSEQNLELRLEDLCRSSAGQQLANVPAHTRFNRCVKLSCLINNNCSITRGIQDVQPPVDLLRQLTARLLLILCTQAQHLHGTAHLHISAAFSTYTTATSALERLMKC